MSPKNTNKARNLRKKQTPQEIMTWARLRNRGFLNLKFRRQYLVGDYIVDFVCFDKKLIVEIDGWQHKEEFCGKKDAVMSVLILIFVRRPSFHIVKTGF